ncbi:sulfite exporter TauE/SafE family protein [Pedobacter sp. N36a]|uniref:sulfite exporter TauE/SafE family protein n=1 Tax=Pedobacter sp. N36a TaxID=2767996 RepID=UPI0016571D1B|nr:sulfite exporter TauE/SafE family protein [Pedobacter sp. N36a]MBC8985297.1 sulfite exporter TauE/SafE family protein [Pedobacter sp. N36a]
MEVIAYLAAAFIGLSLGLIGGGGSILTMPVLVYLFGINPLLATSYSLFVVGSTSLVGTISNYRKGQVNLKAAFFFGLASIVTVYITRKFIVQLIPEHLFSIGRFSVSSALATMVFFGFLMLMASISMIKSKQIDGEEQECKDCIKFFKLLGYGITIGLVTGLLGAGGGFLLIPALVFLVKLPMKNAIGTSLLIIALNSLIGFTGDLGHFDIQWKFLLGITAIAITGLLIGNLFSKKIPGEKLKKGFGWFVLIMGIYIILKELLK